MPSRWSKDNAKKNAEENKSEIALPLATIARTVQYLFVLVARARSVVRPAGARLHGDTARAQWHLVRGRLPVRVSTGTQPVRSGTFNVGFGLRLRIGLG